jgi:hypothetical protein
VLPSQLGRARWRAISQLEEELVSGTYVVGPSRVAEIAGGREVHVLNALDRAAHRAILTILQPIFELEFRNNSFAYRPRRSIHSAVGMVAWYAPEFPYYLKTDIRQCFPNVLHGPVMDNIGRLVGDQVVLDMVEQSLTAGVLYGPDTSTRGLKQGCPLAPSLLNLILGTLDDLHDPTWRILVRYADDLLFLYRHAPDVEAECDTANSLLDPIGLALSPDKTSSGHLGDSINLEWGRTGGQRFLGMNLQLEGDGLRVRPSDEAVRKLKDQISRTVCDDDYENWKEVKKYLNQFYGHFRRWDLTAYEELYDDGYQQLQKAATRLNTKSGEQLGHIYIKKDLQVDARPVAPYTGIPPDR